MTKKLGVLLLAAAMFVAWAPSMEVAAQSAGNNQVNHAELAKIVANALGLTRFLPVNASFHQLKEILLTNRIAPPGGWDEEAVVTKGDLAVVVVKCRRAMGEVLEFDPDSTRDAMNFLRQEGIPIDTIGAAAGAIKPASNPVGKDVFTADTDPVSRTKIAGQPDTTDFGADVDNTPAERPAIALTREEVIAIIVEIAKPSFPTSRVTPFQP